jgi:hypothetical protein
MNIFDKCRILEEQNNLLHARIATFEHMRDKHLVPALKKAYRKHVQNDDRIGWNELGDVLCDALCEGIGDKGFQEWLSSQVLA